MNNYNYDYSSYDNISNFVPNFSNTSPLSETRINYMPNIDPFMMQFLNQNNNNAQKNQISEPYEGFIRGNIYRNLYDQYKNYKPNNLNSGSEQENMLNQWQQYNFVLEDLKLYLDVNPDNKNILDLYQKYLKIANDIKEQYEKKYGPVTCDSNVILNSNNWNWLDGPWPWEVK